MASGAIFGLVSKIKAMDFVGKIGTQFKTLSYLISDTATGMGSFTSLLSKVGGASKIAVPAIMGVVAAVLALVAAYKKIQEVQDPAYHLDKLSDTKSQMEEIKSEIDAIKSSGEDLTADEEKRLHILEAQLGVLEKQAGKQADRAGKALEEAVISATQHYETDQTTGVVTLVQDAAQAFDNLVSMAEKGQQQLPEYKSGLEDYLKTYGDLADEIQRNVDAGAELTDRQAGVLNSVKMVRAELEYLNEATDSNSESTNNLGYSYNTLEENLSGATAALERFNAAMSTDYSAQFGGYQDAFNSLNESIQSGTANVQQIKSGVELFLPEGTLESLNYDMDAAAKLLAESFSGNFGKILQAEDPIGALTQNILQSNGRLRTDSGETAAYIDSSNRLHIQSYELLAQSLGTTEEAAKALFGVMQSTSGVYLHTEQEVSNLIAGLRSMYGETVNLARDIPAVVNGIAELTGETDPAKIQGWVDALYEASGIKITPEMKVDTTEAINNINDVKTASEEIKDKTVTITEVVEDSELKAAFGTYNALTDKLVTITIKTVNTGGGGVSWDSSGTYVATGGSGMIYHYDDMNATGTKNAKEGVSLINDGKPINGSQAEIVVQNGRAFIPNQGKTGVVNLEAGATVYNARETQAILARSGLSERDLYGGIRSFAAGSTGLDVSRYVGSSSSSGGGVEYYSGGEKYIEETISLKQWYDQFKKFLNFTKADMDAEREWAMQWREENSKTYFDEYRDVWQHFLKMDVITEEEYYKALYALSESYLKNRESLIKDYATVQEEIYSYEKKNLQDIVDLEEKLNDLAKAKTQRVLVYKDGMFQYVQNTESIARAQRAVQGYANGTTNAVGGMQLVGEHGAELRLLNQGDGIIPANLTRNLMRIGSMGINAMGGYGDSYILTIGTLKLEKVNDVDSLFNGLKNYAVQSSAMRR